MRNTNKMRGHHKAVPSDVTKTPKKLLPENRRTKRQMARFLKDRYFWYIAAPAVFVGIFTYAPDIAALGGLAPREGWELAYYVALYRFLFLVSVAIAAWRFGVKGGLAACFALGPIILSPFIVSLWGPNAWLEIGIIIAGILFSWLIGRQGKMRRLLEKNTEELRRQAARLSLEITQRKQAEDEIRDSEKRYRLLAENATDVIWTVDINSPTRLTYISPSVKRLLGYSVEEAKTKTMEEVFTPVSYEVAMKALAEELAIENVEQQDLPRSRTLELELNCKDGSVVPVEINCSIVRDPDGRAVEILVIARDISERKQVEEKIKHAAQEWRMTFDSITDLISIHGKDNRIVRVNMAFADAFNMKPKDVIGKPCYEVVHGTKEPCPHCPHKQTVETKKPAGAEFFEPYLGIYLQVSTSPMFNEKGEVVGSVHVARDITERKQIEEHLVMTDRLASIGELASGIAHELNNPLTSVIGFSELLMEENIPDDVKEDLGIIYSQAQRAAGIIKNLLTFSRKHAPVKQMSHVNSIIEDVLRLRAYEQKVSNIKVNTRFASGLPEIMVDYFQMQQVFLNIIINAESAILEAHNKGRLTITTKTLNNIVSVSFADDGPGIAEENLSRIFTPFFTTKAVGKGTGLGLSICHGIVTEHGGRIYARNGLGKGATFIVELPINGH